MNLSYAVVSRRHDDKNLLDDFPTPPWATRALIEYILFPELCRPHLSGFDVQTVWEPACNRGFMVRPLQEYYKHVIASDIHDYGTGMAFQHDYTSSFLPSQITANKPNCVITNPPFKLLEKFILTSIDIEEYGIEYFAFFARTNCLEGISRYQKIYSKNPPAIVAPFVERVPVVKGRIDRKATTATAASWFIWHSQTQKRLDSSRIIWIPPCRKKLERPEDYNFPGSTEYENSRS